MALSRDGQSIRLTSNESGTAQVVTLGLRGGDATALTNDVATYGGVSAAGDAIVTTRSQTTAGLWLVDAAGRNARQIGRDLSTSLGSLSWAGSARLMYGAAMAGGVGLWSTEIGSGTPDLVVPGRGQGGWSASMSADGRTLVFTRSGGIWRADADGRNAARIADGGPAEITPDGSQVFYISSQSGTQSVWVVDLHGGQPRQFSTLPATGIPTVSPAGRLLMFISGESAVIMPVGGGEPVRKIPMRSTRLRWTPDGRGLTYADVTSTNLWVQPIDGGAPHQLTTFADGKTISSFAWSPDGKQLAIARAVTTSDIVLLKGVR